MNYLNDMGDILTFTPLAVKDQTGLKRLQYYCILNVLVLGLIYGGAAALFSRYLLPGGGAEYNALKIVVAGIPVAFFMHAGAALFIWVFLRAMGGNADFMTSYFHIGAAAISLWILAPFLAVLQAGAASPALMGLALACTVYAFGVNVQVIRSAYGLTPMRMTIATAVTVMYISCFLYLWV